MNRVTRMGIGLLALIPVLLLAGWLFEAFGVMDGEAAGWLALGVAAVWVVLVIWWALRAPAQVSDQERPRYWAALRHSEFQALDDTDSESTSKNT